MFFIYLIFLVVFKMRQSVEFYEIRAAVHQPSHFYATVYSLKISTHHLYGAGGKKHSVVKNYRMDIYRYVIFSVYRIKICIMFRKIAVFYLYGVFFCKDKCTVSSASYRCLNYKFNIFTLVYAELLT